MGYVPFDGTINKNGFPKGNVGDKFKVHLPKKYCEKGSNPVDAVVVDIPFTESYNPNTRDLFLYDKNCHNNRSSYFQISFRFL